MYFVERPPGRHNFPLIDRFVHTGEPLNPWRCESCITKSQRRAAVKGGTADTGNPGCCRKCGCDFYR